MEPTTNDDPHPPSSSLQLQLDLLSQLPTPNSPLSRVVALPHDPFHSPSRLHSLDPFPFPSTANDIAFRFSRTQQETTKPDGTVNSFLNRNIISQMATPASSPLFRDSSDSNHLLGSANSTSHRAFQSNGHLDNFPGMHRSISTTIAPAPILSPDRHTVQMLTDTLAATPDTPTPITSARPDYMRRFKRTRTNSSSDKEDPNLSTRPMNSSGSDNLGITVSPVKGRRLRLLETQEQDDCRPGYSAAFHYSLLLDPTSPTPQTPPHLDPEKLERIERRLTAFSSPTSSQSQLLPADIPGKGRVLISRSTGADLFAISSPSPARVSPKKVVRGRKGAERLPSPPPALVKDPESLQKAIAATTSWPDQEFPWSIHTEERLRQKEHVHKERLARIRRFLEHDTDGEDDDEDEISPTPTRRHRTAERIPSPERGSRSKGPKPHKIARSQSFNVVLDSADAKEVLRASKFASRGPLTTSSKPPPAQQPMGSDEDGEDEGILNCICQTQEDRPMVCCDRCKFWYHQNCMGIDNEDDLEDEWFCVNCTVLAPHGQIVTEPILVPTNEEPVISNANAHLPLYQAYDFPINPQNTTPRAPSQKNGYRSHSLFQTPRADTSNSSHQLPYHSQTSSSNPSTPRRRSSTSEIKVWATPSLFEDVAGTVIPDSPFDPTSTPSRGLKFGIPLISTATPKDLGSWSARIGGLFATPLQQSGGSGNGFGKRALDFSDFTPGMPSWNNSPLALASSSAKGQVLEFGGDLVVAPVSTDSAPIDQGATSTQNKAYAETLVPTADVQVKNPES